MIKLLEVVGHENLADELQYVHVLVQLRCLREPELKTILIRVKGANLLLLLFVAFLWWLRVLNNLLRDHSKSLDEALDVLKNKFLRFFC